MMKWSKVQSDVRDRFAPSVRARISLHQARYRRTREEVGRIWLTIDGREIASFDTNSYVRRRAEIADSIREVNGLRPYGSVDTEQAWHAADDEAQNILRRAGEYDDYRAWEELETYLSMPIQEALDSPSPLLRGIAIIDERVGKRRLRSLAQKAEHPLVRQLLEVRCEAEGLDINAPEQPGR